MPTFQRHDVTLYYEQFGARVDPVVMLIHGLTCQAIHWPPALIEQITDAGFRVVAFDNRDAGRSGRLDAYPVGDVEQAMAAARTLEAPYPLEAPYTLADMAGDAVALLDFLGQSGAHLVGFSMGGMIAQQLALRWPERVFSLTSIASSTSDPDLPGGDRAAFDAFLSTPPEERTAAIRHLANGWRVLGGPYFDSTRVGLARMAERAFDRGYSAAGAARQLLAILQAEPRGAALTGLELPALVIHGDADPLVPLAAGERTAASLSGARLEVFERMGHDLPDPLLDDLAAKVVRHLKAAPAER